MAIFVIALLALTKNLQLCFQSFCAKLVTCCLCYWMNRHSLSLKGGQTCFLLVFHAILRLILNYSFCAISSCELSVCSIFYAFYNYEISLPSSFWFTLSILWCCCFKLKDTARKKTSHLLGLASRCIVCQVSKAVFKLGPRIFFFWGGAVSFYRTVN